MKALESKVASFKDKYLIPVDQIWQPADFLPDASAEDFYDQITSLQGHAAELGTDFWVVLIGDMITEEALPTYESWIMNIHGVDQNEMNPWATWTREWTAEENRHGDLLNKYLYLSGRINMAEVERSTQHLLADGFDNGGARDPYKNFIYTSFQELATHISHKRVAEQAAQMDNSLLARMCRTIAGDEMRHHLAYREFVLRLLEEDPSDVLTEFGNVMKHKIVMPAMYLRQTGESRGESYASFTAAAQRLGIYTSADYVHILQILLAHWKVDSLRGLNENAEKARDFLMALPARLTRLAERISVPEIGHPFKWVLANGKL